MAPSVLIFSFIWSMAFLFVGRLVFLTWNWSIFSKYPGFEIILAFLWGLRFDWVISSLVSVLPFLLSLILLPWVSGLWARRSVYLVLLLTMAPILFINIVDAELYHFLGRRFSAESLFLVQEGGGKFGEIVKSYWPLALASFVVPCLFICLIWRELGLSAETRQWMDQKSPRWARALTMVFIFIFMAIGVRGGLQEKPINFAHAQLFPAPIMNALVMNSGFTFMQTAQRKKLERAQFFSEEDAEWRNYLNAKRVDSRDTLKAYRPKEKPNVVVIVLESFAFEYMGRPFGDKGFTPFLDALSEKALFFNNSYANGRRSIEGIGAIFGGVPALMAQPFISSQYLTNQFFGLGTLLSEEGYESAFFHGAQNGSMYFDSFMQAAGVDKYYGLKEFPDKSQHDGTWGIWDEPFFMWSIEEIESLKRPFMAAIFSLTSHHPFKIPKQYEGRFPKGNLDILESVGYTDYALSEFFKKVEKTDWYKNTLFIVTADHTYKSIRPEMDNELGLYRIPLLFFYPSLDLRKTADESLLVSHIDIIPSVMDFIGARLKKENLLGASVFKKGPRSVVHYMDGRYQMITDRYYLVRERGQDFYYSSQDPQRVKELGRELLPETKKELSDILNAHIQYFSEGLWDNKLYYPSN